jgi:tryptophan halogenase
MNVLVCGAGSAGMLTALTLQHKNPRLRVAVLRDRAVPVIGVGESTFGSFPSDIGTHLGIDFDAFQRAVLPVTKYGLWLAFGAQDFHYSFENAFDWRFWNKPYPEGFYWRRPWGHNGFSRAMIEGRHPDAILPNAGLHLENRRFLAYLEQLCGERGIPLHDVAIESVERDGERVTSINGRFTADLYLDCTGFAARLTQEEWISFGDALLNDRAIVLWRDRTQPVRPYTKATTMPNGWLWEIDHVDGCGIGYVYSSAFASEETAARELAAAIGPFRDARPIRFATGARRRHWVGNVVSIGNSDGFIEPLEATTLTIILRCAVDVGEVLSHAFDRSELVALYNENIDTLYRNVRDFILFHFAFNERLDTPYWAACRKLEDRVTRGSISEFILHYYRRNGPSLKFLDRMYTHYNPFGVEGYYTLFKGLGVRTEIDDLLRETYQPGT